MLTLLLLGLGAAAIAAGSKKPPAGGMRLPGVPSVPVPGQPTISTAQPVVTATAPEVTDVSTTDRARRPPMEDTGLTVTQRLMQNPPGFTPPAPSLLTVQPAQPATATIPATPAQVVPATLTTPTPPTPTTPYKPMPYMWGKGAAPTPTASWQRIVGDLRQSITPPIKAPTAPAVTPPSPLRRSLPSLIGRPFVPGGGILAPKLPLGPQAPSTSIWSRLREQVQVTPPPPPRPVPQPPTAPTPTPTIGINFVSRPATGLPGLFNRLIPSTVRPVPVSTLPPQAPRPTISVNRPPSALPPGVAARLPPAIRPPFAPFSPPRPVPMTATIRPPTTPGVTYGAGLKTMAPPPTARPAVPTTALRPSTSRFTSLLRAQGRSPFTTTRTIAAPTRGLAGIGACRTIEDV